MQLEYVRDELSEALLAYSAPARNQIVAMSERAQASGKHNDWPMREVSMGDDRVILVEAEPVSGSETRNFKDSKLPVSPAIFRQTRWRNALYLLPDQYSAWLRYCYGDDLSFAGQQLLVTHVWSAFKILQSASGLPAMAAKSNRRMQALVWLSVQENKYRVNRGAFRHSYSELAALCEVTEASFTMTIKPRWQAMLAVCEQLDREALIHVGQLQKSTGCGRG